MYKTNGEWEWELDGQPIEPFMVRFFSEGYDRLVPTQPGTYTVTFKPTDYIVERKSIVVSDSETSFLHRLVPGGVEILGYGLPIDREIEIPQMIAGKSVVALDSLELYGNALPGWGSMQCTLAYRDGISELIIPEGVKAIGKNAFTYNKLSEIHIPDSVVFVGSLAFDGNPNLQKITIGQDVELEDTTGFPAVHIWTDFVRFYNGSVGKAAGTYIFKDNAAWERE